MKSIEHTQKIPIKEERNNRAPGPEAIRTELCKYRREKLTQTITKTFAKSEKGEPVPLDWNTICKSLFFFKGENVNVANTADFASYHPLDQY